MARSRQPWRLVWLVALLAATCTGAAHAAEALLDGELGGWLDSAVAPELGETLSRHPRFSGATVRLVTVVPGAAPGQSNRLARAVERRLRQRLLAIDGVRLAVERPARGCEPPRTIDYLVRIEITPVGARSARLHVAVVDVAESVWVSGISHQWQGRLSGRERAAFAEAVSQVSAGSAVSPIPLDTPRDVAEAMKADLACLLPGGLDGALFVAVPDDPALARVGLALQSELAFEPLAALTADREAARWLLTLEAGDATADVRELNLTLADADGGNGQRVGSVFVAGAFGTPPVAEPAPPVAAGPAVVPGPVSGGTGLLTTLAVSPAAPEGICDARRARVNSCAQIDFELTEPAYLFVLSTRDHAVVDAPCGARLTRSDAGPRRFRVRVPPGGHGVDPAAAGPDAGFYVLAVRSRSMAARLQAALAAAPGQCGRSADAPAAGWLDALQSVLDRDAGQIAWRAVHLVHGRSGIEAL